MMLCCWGTLKSSHLSTDNFRPDYVVILSLVSVSPKMAHWALKTMWDMEQSLIILVDPTSHQNNSWCSAIKESREDFCGICHLYIFAKWSVGDFSSAFPFPVLHLSRMHNSLCPFSSFSGFVFSKPRRVASLVHACLPSRNLISPPNIFLNILLKIHFIFILNGFAR